MARRKRQQQNTQVKQPPCLCVYCGIRPAMKRDHVIARVFFDKLPKQMITVPSCDECDNGTGDGGPHGLNIDENYFRDVLCLRRGSINHPVAAKLRADKVLRSLEHSNSKASSIFSPILAFEAFKELGIHVAPPAEIKVSERRIHRVIRKIVRGMYYDAFKSPLTPDVQIDVQSDVPLDELKLWLPRFGTRLTFWYGFDDYVFLFKFARAQSDPLYSFWLFQFYRSFFVLAVTHRPASSIDGGTPRGG